jgi:hypothetical protein
MRVETPFATRALVLLACGRYFSASHNNLKRKIFAHAYGNVAIC